MPKAGVRVRHTTNRLRAGDFHGAVRIVELMGILCVKLLFCASAANRL